MKKFLIMFCCLFPALCWGQAVSVSDLRVEQLKNPVGIATDSPRLGWKIESKSKGTVQTAYRILMASAPELLNEKKADIWDSQKVNSDESQWVAYGGSQLKSNQKVYWKVKSFTNKGTSAWSDVAEFSVALLKEGHWKGQWIGLDKAAPGDEETQWSRLASRYLRKEFNLKKEVKRATAYIAGLGMYELFINGQRVGDQVLAPAPTDYRKSVIYNCFDVTSLLKEKNAVGVALGNGRFYTMRQNYKTYKITNFGYPKLRFDMIVEYTDGTTERVSSNNSWKLTTNGPIRSNNEYDGEEYDARKELTGWTEPGYDDSEWIKAERVSIPTGTLTAAMAPNMKVVQTVKPVSITPLGDKMIVDLGQNIAGRLRMNVRGGNAGDTIRLRFAETLQKDGNLYIENLRDARCTDTYICSGKENNSSWAPAFVYHGFRYIEVSGYKGATVDDFIGEAISDEMDCLGTFSCSNETLNAIYRNAWWGVLSNYKGLPVDCPQRNERQPWLGDRTMGCWGESFLFGNDRLYAKWANDICEAQRSDGCIPDVAPAFWNYYSDNVTWPAALPMACDMVYTQFGDKGPIVKHYNNIKNWMNHIKEEYMNSEMIVTKDTYGDWCVPPESLELIHSNDPTRNTSGELISTAYYLKMLQTMHRFAEIQGLEDDKEMWKELEHSMKDAFNKKFLTIKKGTSQVPGHPLYPDSIYYGNNTVTANILPLAFGLVPSEYIDDVTKNVVKTIITGNNGHICTGVIGVQWLMRELSRRGFADVAFLLASNTTYPSYGYMVANGATTIWELWNGNTASPKMNSGNHVMLLGDLLPWFYENIGGIKSDRKKVGFKHIVMRPNFEIQDLSSADVSYDTPYGKVSSKWKKTLQHLDWEVTIPANCTAELHLPDGKVEQIGSGNYSYSVDIPTNDKRIVTDEFLYEKASFPECHSSTIVELKNGDLVATFFGGTKEANPDVCIWVCRKPKGSKEWTAPVLAADGVFSLDDPLIAKAGLSGIDENSTLATAGPVRDDFDGDIEKSRRKACWNPVLFEAPNGELWLFFKIGRKVVDWTGWMVRSTDGGKTWSKREPLQDGFLGPIKNKPVMIGDRIICPSSTEGSNGWRIHFEISDDMGKTWKMVGPIEAELDLPTAVRKANSSSNTDDQEGGEAIKGNDMKPIFAIQPSVLKVGDRLCVLCRTRNAKLATSWSDDNGDTWSKVTLTDVPNNNSGTDAVTLKDGSHALIYNDFETLPGTPKGVRTPLAIAVSKDGVNWSRIITLEDSPISQYSYPSIIQGKDGSLHCIYTWRRQRIKYVKIKL